MTFFGRSPLRLLVGDSQDGWCGIPHFVVIKPGRSVEEWVPIIKMSLAEVTLCPKSTGGSTIGCMVF